MLFKKNMLQDLIMARAEGLVAKELKVDFRPFLTEEVECKITSLKKRGADIVKCSARGKILSVEEEQAKTKFFYNVHFQFLIKQDEYFYIEENVEDRAAIFHGDTLIADEAITFSLKEPTVAEIDGNNWDRKRPEEQIYYNRLAAVQYAEKWWNSRNPSYKNFEVNCTNFISQCLHAGGASMRGYPNKGSGWWMQNNAWSYSWSVANAFYQYLKASKTGLRAKQVFEAKVLLPGDVICYDFDGDGKWDHTTIVVAKDIRNMPLVNAHTLDSRMRYWAYEDSTAYTPKVKYAFFQIADE